MWVDLDPHVILDCGGSMLVLGDDRDWLIGQMEAEIVKCWAGCGPNLERALKLL